jgi:hypothetical protein
MPTYRQRKRGPKACSRGRYVCVNLDPLTHARVVHQQHVTGKVLGENASISTVIRLAVERQQAHIDALLAKIEKIAAGAPEITERLVQSERLRVLIANRGGDAPAPVVVEEALNNCDALKPFGEWLRSHRLAHLRVSVPQAGGSESA